MEEPPTYRDLLVRTDGPPGTTWGLFAEHAERGAANFADAAGVLAAAATVTTGAVFNLDYSLDAFDPALFPPRGAPVHEITAMHAAQRDDVVREFYPQASSQLDGLRHRRSEEFGFYGGAADDQITVGTATLGVQRWAEVPIVGRGVLVDVAAARIAAGAPIDYATSDAIELETIEAALVTEQTTLARGDLVLLHTGWARWYLGLDETVRSQVRARKRYPGIAQSRELLAWLYDNRVALIASDTPALEVIPPISTSPFRATALLDDGMMHQELIAKLGLPIGELWKLDEITTACRDAKRWEFLLAVKPINLVGGVGSPPNATAVW